MPTPSPERPVSFTGPLAAVFYGLIAEKRGAGYRYDATAHDLIPLDRFCVAVGLREASLPRDFVLHWANKRKRQALAQATRVTSVEESHSDWTESPDLMKWLRQICAPAP